MNTKNKKQSLNWKKHSPSKSRESRTINSYGRWKKRRLPKRFGLIIDFFPSGRSSLARNRNQRYSKPIAHVLDDRFSLIELTLPDRNSYSSDSKASIKFCKSQITRRLQFEDISQSAQGEIPSAVEKIVYRKPNHFLRFFNNAESISPRFHQLRLLPGIGTARMWKILEARKDKPFTSVEDLKKRTGLSDPLGMITQRVIAEIKEQPSYSLFVQSNSDDRKLV